MIKSCVWTLTMLALCAPASAEIFTFEDVATFTSVPFSVTSGNITADFSSPQGPVFFIVTAAPFASLSGNVLIDSDAAFNELRIVFGQPLQTVSLVFALNSSQVSDTISLGAFLGGTQVGSASAMGTVPGGGFAFPEGSISFSGSVFDEVRMTSNATDFAIDNVDVSPAQTAIPEPSTVWLGGAGVTVLAICKRKRNILRSLWQH